MGRLGVCGGVSLAGEDPTWWNMGLTCALRPGSGDTPFIDLRYGITNENKLSDGSRPVQYGPICCIGYRWVIRRRHGPAIKFGLGGMYGTRKTYAYSNGVYRMSAVWYPALDLSLAIVFR